MIGFHQDISCPREAGARFLVPAVAAFSCYGFVVVHVPRQIPADTRTKNTRTEDTRTAQTVTHPLAEFWGFLPASSPNEQREAAQTRDAQGYLRRRQVARALAGAVLACDPARLQILRAPGGAPILHEPGLPHPPLHLSFAARGDHAVVALSARPIGVDLERLPNHAGIAWNILRLEERKTLRALPQQDQPRAFAALFCTKEAVLKAAGTGFALPPEAVLVAPGGHSARVETSIPALGLPQRFANGTEFEILQSPLPEVCDHVIRVALLPARV